MLESLQEKLAASGVSLPLDGGRKATEGVDRLIGVLAAAHGKLTELEAIGGAS